MPNASNSCPVGLPLAGLPGWGNASSGAPQSVDRESPPPLRLPQIHSPSKHASKWGDHVYDHSTCPADHTHENIPHPDILTTLPSPLAPTPSNLHIPSRIHTISSTVEAKRKTQCAHYHHHLHTHQSDTTTTTYSMLRHPSKVRNNLNKKMESFLAEVEL